MNGCVLRTPVSYSGSRRGQQKCLEQPRERRRRISILGLLQIEQKFDYGLIVGEVRSSIHIKLMDWQVRRAKQHQQATAQLTDVVQDNASIQRNQPAQQ